MLEPATGESLMRETRDTQLRLAPGVMDHERGRELVAMSEVLDAVPEILEFIRADLLDRGQDPERGRPGLTAEQVLRALVIKQMNQFSYDELAFHLGDSVAYRTFCRFGFSDPSPRKSALQQNIKSLHPETLEQVNRVLIAHAEAEAIEKGRKVRCDSTVVEANIHEPTDSRLLYDVVRVLARIMNDQKLPRGSAFKDETRRAKRLNTKIWNAKDRDAREPVYRELVKVARRAIRAAKDVANKLDKKSDEGKAVAAELHRFVELGLRVIDQTVRRVFREEKVPATEKVVSIFEPHVDILVKDRRETLYGHKVYLTSGASSLILDCTIEPGNPADSTLTTKLIERLEGIYDRAPRQASFDGGFASRANLTAVKEKGVKDVAFSKKCGLKIAEMVTSSTVYQKLRNFRAGIEAGISFLKRSFGLDRCTWRGLESFQAYVWSSIISANLLVLARHSLG